MKRKIDDLGRIVIPAGMRNELGLANGSEAECNLRGNEIIITNPKKYDINEYLKEAKERYTEDQEITKEMVIEEFNKIIEMIERNKY